MIAELATRQHGVVARWQLERLGMSRHEIGGRIRAGRLHPLHRAVYAVGHRRLSREGRYLAAVLSAGEGAALSHCSAADLWELRATKEPRIDVTARTNLRGDWAIRIRRNGFAPKRTTLWPLSTFGGRSVERERDLVGDDQIATPERLLELHPVVAT